MVTSTGRSSLNSKKIIRSAIRLESRNCFQCFSASWHNLSTQPMTAILEKDLPPPGQDGRSKNLQVYQEREQ